MDQFEVENKEVQKMLKEMMDFLVKELPPNYGLTLFIFSYGEGGNCFYASTAMREDMLKMLKEFIARKDKLG